MEELPISAGLQIINAESASKGIARQWANSGLLFDSASVIDEAFKKLEKR